MIRMDSVRVLIVLLFLVICGACRKPEDVNVPLSKEFQADSTKVALELSVEKPDEIYYYGKGNMAGAAFGIVGHAVATEATKDTKTQIKEFMEKEGIDVSKIVSEEFKNQISTSGIFHLVPQEGSDAVIKVKIYLYGLSIKPLGSPYYPMLGVKGSLVKSDGSLLWQKTSIVGLLDKENFGEELETYQKEPAKLRSAFENASRLVINKLVLNLRKK